MDFAIPALRQLLSNTDMQFVGLGMGDFGLQSAFGKLGEDFGGKARTMLRMDMPLARKIYAASDLILLPSRYEPCGLAQIIAMRYGCLPLVRETGGLVDTVDNYDGQGGGTGFRFLFEETEALVGTVRWALDTYHNQKDHWQQMQDRAMGSRPHPESRFIPSSGAGGAGLCPIIRSSAGTNWRQGIFLNPSTAGSP